MIFARRDTTHERQAELFTKSLRNKSILYRSGTQPSRAAANVCFKASNCHLGDKRTREQIGEEADKLEALELSLPLGENYLENLCEGGHHPAHPRHELFYSGTPAGKKKRRLVTSEMELFFDLAHAKSMP